MAASTFLPHSQSFRLSGPSHFSLAALDGHYKHDAVPRLDCAPSVSASPQPVSVLIRRLPLNTSEESLRLMAVWSTELAHVELLPIEMSEDAGFRSATLTFKSPAGAQEAKNMLDGRPNISNDAEMIVDILSSSPVSARGFFGADRSTSTSSCSSASTTTVLSASARQMSRFNAPYHSLNHMANSSAVMFTVGELPNPESGSVYQDLFSPQSPIGNHMTDRAGISGKTLINNDAADDETGKLLQDPLAYAESGHVSATIQRRATAPQLPSAISATTLMAGLSLHSSLPNGPSLSHYLATPSTRPVTMPSPNTQQMNGGGTGGTAYPISATTCHYPRQNFPSVNPADQNPPCNTLYVGNLPIDTSEEELKAIFSKQRGYKRLCFRTKQNGPMCFVEFEDVTFATKTLHELYGLMLHNSVKGGIRLSFSKNPLGVRSGQPLGQHTGLPGAISVSGANGMMSSAMGAFTAITGPPPGLAVPPGFGPARVAYSIGSHHPASPSSNQLYTGSGYLTPSTGANIWNSPAYDTTTTSSISPSTSVKNGSPSTYLPAHMMGR